MSSSCVICHEQNIPLIKVTEKGIKTLIDCSKRRNESEILNTLEDANLNHKDIFVHIKCRKTFTDKRKLLVQNSNKRNKKINGGF